MKILHTSDWHIGKRLGRHDRMGEFAEVLAEVEAIADERDVDLVLVSGDVWDRPMPPTDALHLGLQTLLRLAEGRPVVAVAGNHDSAGLFEALAPLLRPLGVFLIGDVKRPDQGALLGPDDLGVPAVVAGFPFLREGRVVDFMAEAGEWYRAYAEKVAAITAHVQRGARGAGGRRRRADPDGALHGGRGHDRSRGAARRARTPHGRRLRRHRPGDPRRPAVRRDGSHPRAAGGARRARAGPLRGLAAGAGLRRGRRAEAGASSSTPNPASSPPSRASRSRRDAGSSASPTTGTRSRRGPRSWPRRSSTSPCGPPAPT